MGASSSEPMPRGRGCVPLTGCVALTDLAPCEAATPEDDDISAISRLYLPIDLAPCEAATPEDGEEGCQSKITKHNCNRGKGVLCRAVWPWRARAARAAETRRLQS